MAKFLKTAIKLGYIAQPLIFKHENTFTSSRLACNFATKAVNGETVLDEETYIKTDKLYKHSKKGTAEALQTILPDKERTISQLLTYNPELYQVLPIIIKENCETCKLYGISIESIIAYPYILAQKDLTEKVHILSKLSNDINTMIGLLKLNVSELHKLQTVLKDGKNRIVYLAEMLNVPLSEMCEHIATKKFLRHIKLEKATELIHLLREHGVTNSEIANDLWALQYNKNTMEKRILIAKENNLDKIKTWMIRAKLDIFSNYIKIRSDNKLILGNNSLAEYLSRRLECPIEQANYIINKLPALKAKSVKKMDEIIDYLYGQGFKPAQLCAMPKIFLHSVDTMKKRIDELRQYGVYVDMVGLSIITKTQKQYEVFYNTLVRNNKKKRKRIK